MEIKRELINNVTQLDIPGLTFRRYNGEEDLPAFVEISNAANQADEIDEVSTLENLQQIFRHLRNCDPAKDMIIAEVDENMIGFGRVWWGDVKEPGDNNYHSYMHFSILHPDWRGKGINIAMYDWLENRAIEISKDHPAEARKFLNTWFSGKQIKMIAQFKERGFEPERYFYEMTSDLSKPFSDAPMPDGLETRPVEESHYRKIWEALDEAFRDHWGHIDGTEEDYQRFVSNVENLPMRDPKHWMVAWDGDEVAGMVLNGINEKENETFNRKWGWTDPICVRRAWRKRGLARALIIKSLKLVKELGMEYGALGVDAQNPNKALNLYESCGFETREEFMVVRKKLME